MKTLSEVRGEMLTKVFSARVYDRVCCFVLFLLAASASFNGFYQECHFHEVGISGAWESVSFDRMLDGTAERPYVYRRLLSAIANGVDRVMPQSVKSRLYDHQGSSPVAYIDAISNSPMAKSDVYFFRYLVVYVATFLFALLAVYAMYFVCRAAGTSPPAAVLSASILILLLPYIMESNGYNYDYSELALMALAVWIALRFDGWWCIPIAALGTWNKESFLLFVPALYPLFRIHSSRRGAWRRVVILCLVCAAVYLPIHHRFAHNPGSTVVVAWREQLQLLLHPRALLFSTQQTYGVRVPRAFSLIPAALMVWTVWRGWRHLPAWLQRHGQIAAAINFSLYLLFSQPGELRDLSMLYITFLLVLAANLDEWLGRSAAGLSQTAG